jgi:CHASE3 domain sensor protein
MLKPSSILQLTITGFLAVTGLLIIALVSTANQMSGLSDRSQRVVGLTVIAMNASRTLLEQTTAMERNARQFSIVRDPEIFDVYRDRRQTFANAADRLKSSNLTQSLIEHVTMIETLEQNAFAAMATCQWANENTE